SLEMMGRSAHEVIGRRILDVVPEVKDTLYKLLQHVYTTGERHVAEEVAVSYYRNGEMVDTFAKFFYEPLRDEHGTITGIIISGDDITTHVEARKKIKENEEKYKQLTATLEEQIRQRTAELLDTQDFLQQLIDASVEFICVLDNDLRFITVNKKYEGALNTTREELKGRHVFEISPKAENTIQHESMLKALNGETIYLDKRQALARPEYFVDTYFLPLVLKQKVEGVIIMSRDVTYIVR